MLSILFAPVNLVIEVFAEVAFCPDVPEFFLGGIWVLHTNTSRRKKLPCAVCVENQFNLSGRAHPAIEVVLNFEYFFRRIS